MCQTIHRCIVIHKRKYKYVDTSTHRIIATLVAGKSLFNQVMKGNAPIQAAKVS